MTKRFYQFQVDGRACGPLRSNWKDAAADAVDNGMGIWSGKGIKLSENLGAEIARIDLTPPKLKVR